MRELQRVIGLWQEDEGSWIVSLDGLDRIGNAETTHTLAVFEPNEERKAIAYARKEAKARHLSIVT